MRFLIIFEISPSGAFGVPEERKTVLPAKDGEYLGLSIHEATLTPVGYGSLSIYRKENEAIKLSLNFGGIQGQIQDNFLFLQTEAATYNEAYNTVVQTLEKFLQYLSLSQRRPFTYKPLVIESEDSQIYPIPKLVTIADVTSYHLEKLMQDIQEAVISCPLQDSRLERALQYFEHSLFIWEKRKQIADAFSRHYQYLIATVFLNLWKAVSTVVGDPNNDKKEYQSRYKKFGFDYDFFINKIEYLRELRNNYDIAHYSLDENRLKEIDAIIGNAQNIAAEVLTQYRRYLLR